MRVKYRLSFCQSSAVIDCVIVKMSSQEATQATQVPVADVIEKKCQLKEILG